MHELNETHDPALRSWVPTANEAGGDFPIQNLPFCVFRRRTTAEKFRCGVAIGDQIVDLATLGGLVQWSGPASEALRAGSAEKLNPLMQLGPAHWSALRLALSRALRADTAERSQMAACLVAQHDAEFDVPAAIGDFSDFFSSIYHAQSGGSIVRPNNPLFPNYEWVPIGYHSRASTVGISGESFQRPLGQIRQGSEGPPILMPTRRLDIELEIGIIVGTGNPRGQAIPVANAEHHIFGLTLLNDWSARDIQRWEYQPLGPFLAKNFATTLSPWVVTLEALAPFRAPLTRPAGRPNSLPYLDWAPNNATGALDISLSATLLTAEMRANGQYAAVLCETNYKHAYWTMAQLVAHHTINGCSLRTGDLLGTGTMSGPLPQQAASLLEMTRDGANPLILENGQSRTYLEDGDSVEIYGWCERPGAARIGFGTCVATILPAPAA